MFLRVETFYNILYFALDTIRKVDIRHKEVYIFFKDPETDHYRTDDLLNMQEVTNTLKQSGSSGLAPFNYIGKGKENG